MQAYEKLTRGDVQGVIVKQDGQGLHIVWKWNNKFALVLMFFAAITLHRLLLPLWEPSLPFDDVALLPKAFFALVLIYVAIANAFNSTHINIKGHLLTVKHHPLWFFVPSSTTPVTEVAQVYVVEKINRVPNLRGRMAYEVWLKRKNATPQKIMGFVLTYDQAVKVEQEIEKALGIQDEPVEGEYRGQH